MFYTFFLLQGYAPGPKWKKLMIYWNENLEKTTSIDLQFHPAKLSGESCFTHFLNYDGLCKERSTKQARDTFQRKALPREIMETLKKSIFSFTIESLVSSWRKNPKFFPKLCFWWLSKCPNSKKTPLPRQIPGYAPVL